VTRSFAEVSQAHTTVSTTTASRSH
jgi:hypothetical protein